MQYSDHHLGKWVAFDYGSGQILISADSHDELLAEIRQQEIVGLVITRIAAVGETLSVGFG